jgi:hypothetical protein
MPEPHHFTFLDPGQEPHPHDEDLTPDCPFKCITMLFIFFVRILLDFGNEILTVDVLYAD